MAEYWKSTPKYWCKHCSTYVKDTPFERKQHENTGKHQGNLKRFLRDIQIEHARDERSKERAKAEVERLNRVVGAPSASASSHSVSTYNPASKSKPAASSASDQKRQWAQLAEMGIKIPDSARADMAIPSEWTTISKQVVGEVPSDETHSVGVRKRKFEGQEEEEAAGELVMRKGWGSTMKRYPGSNDEYLDDLFSGAVKINSKDVKKEDLEQGEIGSLPGQEPKFRSSMDDSEHNEDGETISRLETAARPSPTGSSSKVKVDSDATEAVIGQGLEADSQVPIFKKRKMKNAAVKKDSG